MINVRTLALACIFPLQAFAQSADFQNALSTLPATRITSPEQFPCVGGMYAELPNGTKFIVGSAGWNIPAGMPPAMAANIAERSAALGAKAQLARYMEELIDTVEVTEQFAESGSQGSSFNQAYKERVKSEARQLIRGAEILRSSAKDNMHCVSVGISFATTGAARAFQSEINRAPSVTPSYQSPSTTTPTTGGSRTYEWNSPIFQN